LTQVQFNKLQALHDRQQKSMLRLFTNLRPDTLLKGQDRLQKDWAELAQTADKAVSEILTPKQRTRLEEISLQQRGGWALGDPQVAEALQLTQEQRQQIQTIEVAAAKEVQDLALKQMQGFLEITGNPLDLQKAFPTMAKSQKAFLTMAKEVDKMSQATSGKLLEVLTVEQKTKWKELMGKPFRSK
jgi:hypothetical protein